MAKIVLPLRGGPPPEPPYGGLGEEGWARGLTFYDFVNRAAENRAELESAYRDCPVSTTLGPALASYPRAVRVLALLDDGDWRSRQLVARAERLFTLSTRIWMRIFDARSCADLVARYAPGGKRLPVLVFFGEDQQEFARHHLTEAGTASEPGLSSSAPDGTRSAEADDALQTVDALQRLLAKYATAAS